MIPAGTALEFVGTAGTEDPCTYILPSGLLFKLVEGPDAGGLFAVYPTRSDDPEMLLVRLIVGDE